MDPGHPQAALVIHLCVGVCVGVGVCVRVGVGVGVGVGVCVRVRVGGVLVTLRGPEVGTCEGAS